MVCPTLGARGCTCCPEQAVPLGAATALWAALRGPLTSTPWVRAGGLGVPHTSWALPLAVGSGGLGNRAPAAQALPSWEQLPGAGEVGDGGGCAGHPPPEALGRAGLFPTAGGLLCGIAALSAARVPVPVSPVCRPQHLQGPPPGDPRAASGHTGSWECPVPSRPALVWPFPRPWALVAITWLVSVSCS